MANIGFGAIEGPYKENVTAVSANYTVLPTDQLIEVTTGTSNLVVTLPAPSIDNANAVTSGSAAFGNVGQIVRITKVDSGGNGTTTGTISVVGTFITAAHGSYGIKAQYSQLTFQSDGTTWYVIGQVS